MATYKMCIALLLVALVCAPLVAAPLVEPLPMPTDGLQPEAVVDAEGNLHLLFFRGDPASGDLYYSRGTFVTPAGDPIFTTPARVNSIAGTAITLGTVRGGHLALGAGRVHVAWMSADRDAPGMFYSRDDGTGGFEPQRNLSQVERHLDGGGSLAVDDAGRVHVVWHAGTDEPTRRVWIATSADSGRTFTTETRANPVEAGACGCCGLRAAAGDDLFIVYRAATDGNGRGMQLLRSEDGGSSFDQFALDEWNSDTCPMSTAAILPRPGGALLAWERQGQIWFTTATAASDTAAPQSVPGDGGNRKHPALAVDAAGNVLLAWVEGSGWGRGGDLVWQLYGANREPLNTGRIDDAIPVWSRAAVVARPGGGFYLLF